MLRHEGIGVSPRVSLISHDAISVRFITYSLSIHDVFVSFAVVI